MAETNTVHEAVFVECDCAIGGYECAAWDEWQDKLTDIACEHPAHARLYAEAKTDGDREDVVCNVIDGLLNGRFGEPPKVTVSTKLCKTPGCKWSKEPQR